MLQKEQQIVVRDSDDVTALEHALLTISSAAFRLQLPRDYRDEGALLQLLNTAADKGHKVALLESHLEPDDEAMFTIQAAR